MPTDVATSPAQVADALRVVVGRLRRRLLETVDNEQLTPSQTSLISRLAKGGPATASALAAAERVRPQSVAATLAVLDERGLVRREQDPSDGRRQLVSLTAAGEELFAGRRRASTEWLAQALDQEYSEAERRTIAEAATLLERLIAP